MNATELLQAGINEAEGKGWSALLEAPSIRELLRRAERESKVSAALGDAIEAHWCVATSGGTGGKWCVNHDTPMDNETECHWLGSLRAALAPTEAP